MDENDVFKRAAFPGYGTLRTIVIQSYPPINIPSFFTNFKCVNANNKINCLNEETSKQLNMAGPPRESRGPGTKKVYGHL